MFKKICLHLASALVPVGITLQVQNAHMECHVIKTLQIQLLTVTTSVVLLKNVSVSQEYVLSLKRTKPNKPCISAMILKRLIMPLQTLVARPERKEGTDLKQHLIIMVLSWKLNSCTSQIQHLISACLVAISLDLKCLKNLTFFFSLNDSLGVSYSVSIVFPLSSL